MMVEAMQSNGSGKRSSKRLDAIGRGEAVEAEVHSELAGEASVLDVTDFALWYGRAKALYDINMRIPRGKVTAMIGPSGCGKSTLPEAGERGRIYNFKY